MQDEDDEALSSHVPSTPGQSAPGSVKSIIAVWIQLMRTSLTASAQPPVPCGGPLSIGKACIRPDLVSRSKHWQHAFWRALSGQMCTQISTDLCPVCLAVPTCPSGAGALKPPRMPPPARHVNLPRWTGQIGHGAQDKAAVHSVSWDRGYKLQQTVAHKALCCW